MVLRYVYIFHNICTTETIEPFVHFHSDVFSYIRSQDAGLWACLLLPSVANGIETEGKSLNI